MLCKKRIHKKHKARSPGAASLQREIIEHQQIIITQKQAQARAQESEALCHAIFEHSFEGILLTAPDGHLFAANPAACKMLGRTEAELCALGGRPAVVADPSDPHFLAMLAERQRTGHVRGELTYQRGDGSVFPVEISSTVFHGANNEAYASIFFHDISERKQADAALKESESRFREVLENSLDASYKRNLKTDTYDYLSPVFTKISGYSVNTMKLSPINAVLGLVHPDDFAETDRMLTATMFDSEKTAHQLEYRFKHKNGQYRWFCDQFIVIHDADGIPAARIGSISDITERKLTENALHVSLDYLQAVLDGANDAVFVHDAETGLIVDINQRVCELYGYTYEEALRLSIADISQGDPPYSRANGVLWMQKAREIGPQTFEWRAKHKNGQLFWVEISMRLAMFDQDARFVVTVRDITDRKQTEAALRESEQRYRLLANHANDVIWTMSLDGRFTYVSPSIFQLRGLTPEEALQQSLEQSICPTSLSTVRNEIRHALKEIKRSQRYTPRYFNVEQPCKNGSTIWTEITTCLMYNETGLPTELIGISRNITERKQLQDKLRHQASTDELTGVFNRRQFIESAQNELKRAARLKRSVTIAVLDIDYFKHINDTFGHATGDQVLIAFAQICKTNIREIDLFARIGGDEFAFLLPETNLEQAYMMIERVRLALTARPLDLTDGPSVSITCSTGITVLTSANETLDELLKQADRALYEAKEAGRNCTFLCHECLKE